MGEAPVGDVGEAPAGSVVGDGGSYMVGDAGDSASYSERDVREAPASSTSGLVVGNNSFDLPIKNLSFPTDQQRQTIDENDNIDVVGVGSPVEAAAQPEVEAVVESEVEKEAEAEAEEESYLAVDTGTENFGGLSRFTQLSKTEMLNLVIACVTQYANKAEGVKKNDREPIRAAVLERLKRMRIWSKDTGDRHQNEIKMRKFLHFRVEETREKAWSELVLETQKDGYQPSSFEKIFKLIHQTFHQVVSEFTMKTNLAYRFRLAFRCPHEKQCRKVKCELAKHNDKREAALFDETNDKDEVASMTDELRLSCKKACSPLCTACGKRGEATCKNCKAAKKLAEGGPVLVKLCPFCLGMMSVYETKGTKGQNKGQNLTMESASIVSLNGDKCLRHLRDACHVTMQFLPSFRFFLAFIFEEIVKQLPPETPETPARRKRKRDEERKYVPNESLSRVEEALKNLVNLSAEDFLSLLRQVENTTSQIGDVFIAARLSRLAACAEKFAIMRVERKLRGNDEEETFRKMQDELYKEAAAIAAAKAAEVAAEAEAEAVENQQQEK